MHAKREMKQRRAEGGFTLVELMVVIAILAILASVVGVNVLGAFGEGAQSAAKTQVKALSDAVVMYKLENKGKLPSDLESLVNNPKRNYLDKKEVPKDPWDNDYVYEVSGSDFRIISYGADGSPGGDGENADIISNELQ
ncbi:MAG: type II secretion system major pseudopilin GspG [Candidatus Hydrogenedentota bacterium]